MHRLFVIIKIWETLASLSSWYWVLVVHEILHLMRTSSQSLGDEIPDGYILPPDNYLKVLLYWLTIQEQVLWHRKIGSRATAEDPMAWFNLFITEMIYVWAGDFKNNLLEKNWSCAILMHNVQLQIDVSWRLICYLLKLPGRQQCQCQSVPD